MTREQYAEAVLQGVQGLDNPRDTEGTRTMHETPYNYDAAVGDDEMFGADDPIKRAGLSTLNVTLTVANLASIALDLFFGDDIAAAALPTNVAAPAIATYRSIIRYLLANPSRLQSILFSSNEADTTGAPVLSSLIITPKRVTPHGLTAQNTMPLRAYQTTQDFRPGRTTLPISTPLDTFSWLNITSDQNNSGGVVTIVMTLFFSKRAEARKALMAPPVTVRPGGRGPVPVK